MKPTTLEGVGSHGEAIYRGWVKPAGADEGPQYIDLQNDSGVDLLEGDVVVVTSDGTIARTSTANDPRPTGVVIDDIDDGESGPVQFFGPVDYVRVAASVTADTYGTTSTTAGSAAVTSDTSEAFVYFTSSGVEPEGFLFGGGGGGSGAGFSETAARDLFLLRRHGEGAVVTTVGSSGATESLDLSSANWFDITLTDNCTLTFSNPPDVVGEWTLILRQDATGSRTVTWPGTVQWQDTDGTSGGSAPTLFTAPTAVDVIVITTLDGGATYGGASEGAGGVGSDLRWEAVTDGEDVFVWESDDLVHEWKAY